MQGKQHNRKSIGRLSRLAMMFSGRVGFTKINYSAANQELIQTAWSRLDLEGRSKTWAPFHLGASNIVFSGSCATSPQRSMREIISRASTYKAKANAFLEEWVWKQK